MLQPCALDQWMRILIVECYYQTKQIYSHSFSAGSFLIVPACLLNNNQSLLRLCLTLSLNETLPALVFSCCCPFKRGFTSICSQSHLDYFVIVWGTSDFLPRLHKFKFYTDSVEITLGWISVPYGLDRCKCHHQRTRWATDRLPLDSLIYSKFPSCVVWASAQEENPLR